MDISVILNRLNPISPYTGQLTLWGLWLYAIMLLTAIMLARQRTPVLVVSVLLTTTLMFCLIDKVGVGYPTGNLLAAKGCDSFLTFFMRIAIFVAPLLAAGLTKSPKSRPFGMIAAALGAAYFLVRGIVDMELFVGGAWLSC